LIQSPPGEIANPLASPRMTADDLLAELKKLPPNELENIPLENIERYKELGPIGWQHVMDQIFNSKDLT
jgi:hypothetical protein